jgi:hypothetical protein
MKLFPTTFETPADLTSIVLENCTEIEFAHHSLHREVLRRVKFYSAHRRLHRLTTSVQIASRKDLSALNNMSSATSRFLLDQPTEAFDPIGGVAEKPTPYTIEGSNRPELLAKAMLAYNQPGRDGRPYGTGWLVPDWFASSLIQGIEQAMSVEAPLASVTTLPYWKNSAA